MSLIKKPSELNVQAKIKMLIYGQAGTGSHANDFGGGL